MLFMSLAARLVLYIISAAQCLLNWVVHPEILSLVAHSSMFAKTLFEISLALPIPVSGGLGRSNPLELDDILFRQSSFLINRSLTLFLQIWIPSPPGQFRCPLLSQAVAMCLVVFVTPVISCIWLTGNKMVMVKGIPYSSWGVWVTKGKSARHPSELVRGFFVSYSDYIVASSSKQYLISGREKKITNFTPIIFLICCALAQKFRRRWPRRWMAIISTRNCLFECYLLGHLPK